jgi:hypothetical protein
MCISDLGREFESLAMDKISKTRFNLASGSDDLELKD